MAVDDGVVAPVIHNAANSTLAEIAAQRRDLEFLREHIVEELALDRPGLEESIRPHPSVLPELHGEAHGGGDAALDALREAGRDGAQHRDLDRHVGIVQVDRKVADGELGRSGSGGSGDQQHRQGKAENGRRHAHTDPAL